MVVVPTSHHVTLRYGPTGIDWAGKAASLLGVLGVGVLIVRPPVDIGPDPMVPKPLPIEPSEACDPLDDPLDDDESPSPDDSTEDPQSASGTYEASLSL
jgi:hypothetical protein